MKRLAIIAPITFAGSAVGGAMVGKERVATPDPKEVAVNGTTSANSVTIDLGASYSIDTIFIGYVRNLAGQSLTISSGVAGFGETARGTVAPADSPIAEPHLHYLFQVAAFTARYITIAIPAGIGATFQIGTIAIGLSFSPTWGHEFGGGRQLLDTSTVERLFGGGFGIEPGAIVSGYQWTFGDLTETEREQLFNIVKRLGSSRSVLVVEDPEATTYLHNRIHWGLFGKLEAYERLNPADTRWSFSISDWG